MTNLRMNSCALRTGKSSLANPAPLPQRAARETMKDAKNLA